MKNIFYFIMFSFFILIGCKKDVEQPALTFPFEVKANPEKIEAGIETLDNVPLTFIINKSYNNTVTMKYNITSLKKFSATDEKGQNIELNKWYNLKRDTLILNYKALEQGEHDIKVLFSNSKEYQVEKKVNLTFANNNEYTIEDVFITNLNTVYQGQEIEYNFKIKPLEGSTQNYEIQFLNFDDLDLNGNSTIFLNDERVNLEEWIKIQPENLHKVKLKSYNAGNKKFVYQIRNSEKTKKIEKDFAIKKATISLENLVLSSNELWLNEPFTISGTIIKTNPNNKKIQYKTWVTKGDENAVNDTQTYRNIQLTDNNFFSEEIMVSNVGEYTINVQVRDEFGNESGVKSFNLKVNSKIRVEYVDVSIEGEKFAGGDGFIYFTYDSYLNLKAFAGNKSKLVKVIVKTVVEYNDNRKKEHQKEIILDYVNSIDEKIKLFLSNSDSVLGDLRITKAIYTIILKDNYTNELTKTGNISIKIKRGY